MVRFSHLPNRQIEVKAAHVGADLDGQKKARCPNPSVNRPSRKLRRSSSARRAPTTGYPKRWTSSSSEREGQTMSHLQPVGVSLLYSFPYWILVDTTSLPAIKEIAVSGLRIRFYPFFRSGVANFVPMPPINLNRIPFLPGIRVNFSPDFTLPTMAAIPELELGATGTASVQLVWGPEWTESPRIFPMDSLRIDVFGTDQDKAEDIGSEVVSRFVQLLRCRSRQWWIEHVAYTGNLRGRLLVLENGLPAGELPKIRGRGCTICGDEKAVDDAMWQLTINEVEMGAIAPLYDLLMLDARYFAITSDIRRSVLDAAVACEQARDVHFERLWCTKTGGSPYKRGRVISGNNLPDHLSRDLLKLTNNTRSYEKEYPPEFATIKNLWDSRGNVAHGKPAQYIEAGKSHVIDGSKAVEFSKTAEHCARWLESL